MSTALAKLVPQNLAEAQEVAAVLAKSELVPKDFVGKPANILLAIMSGSEIGLSPAQSLQSIAVINGRPSIWGDASIGLVEASGLCEGWSDSFDPATNTASFTITRKGRGPITRTFSEADAKAANLLGKPGPWQQYKKRMLFNRARAWALRDCFADVLKGLRIVEEEQDVNPINVTPPATVAAPKRKSETVPAVPVEVVPEPVTAQEEAAQGQAFIPGTEPEEPQEAQEGPQDAPGQAFQAPEGCEYQDFIPKAVTVKEGTNKKGKPYKKVGIQDGAGNWYGSFDTAYQVTAEQAKEAGATLRVVYKVDGNFRNIESVEVV